MQLWTHLISHVSYHKCGYNYHITQTSIVFIMGGYSMNGWSSGRVSYEWTTPFIGYPSILQHGFPHLQDGWASCNMRYPAYLTLCREGRLQGVTYPMLKFLPNFVILKLLPNCTALKFMPNSVTYNASNQHWTLCLTVLHFGIYAGALLSNCSTVGILLQPNFLSEM